MADNVTTSGNAASKTTKSSKQDDGYETITVRVPKERDEVATQRLISQLEGPKQTIVGNFADLQRMGAAAVTGGSVEDGVFTPPESEPKDAQKLEDVVAPGPVAFGADAAEEAFGDRVAQGERPDKGK